MALWTALFELHDTAWGQRMNNESSGTSISGFEFGARL